MSCLESPMNGPQDPIGSPSGVPHKKSVALRIPWRPHLAIRELVEAYAHCADRRDVQGQMSLFNPETHFIVFMDTKSSQPSMDLQRREDLAPVFADLKKYQATTHFLGQSTLVLNGDQATGETDCLAIMFSHRRKNGRSLWLRFVITMFLSKPREGGCSGSASPSWTGRKRAE